MRRHLPLTTAYLASLHEPAEETFGAYVALTLVLLAVGLGTAGLTAGCAALAWFMWG